MRRFAFVSVFCLAGCTTSPVYIPGMHPSAPLGSKGSITGSYVIKAPNGREAQVAAVLTERWFVRAAEKSISDGPDLANSHFDLALGRLTRDSSSQAQWSIGYSAGDSRSATAGFLDFWKYEGAPYMALGRYARVYVQQATTRTFGPLEVGGSARVSAVRVADYRRFSGTMRANKAIGGPYNRDTSFSGNLSGVFAEPSLFFGVNYLGIRVTPQLSFAMPLSSTAFGAMPAEIGVTFAIDSDVLKRWPK